MLGGMSNRLIAGAIIVAAPQHQEFVLPLITDLSKGVPEFDEIIVVLSGFDRGGPKETAERLLSINSGVELVQQPLQSAGANRNAGLKMSRSKLVFFMDADDVYSPHRISVALSLFEHHQYDLMLHGFTPFIHGDSPPPFSKPPLDFEAIEVVRESSLYEATLLRSPRNRSLELRGETETTNLLFNDPAEAFEVHHAHAIVRREAVGDIRYHEEFGIRNEDGVFARDMLEAGKKVLLTPFVLSAYRHGARAKPRKPSNFFGWQR